MTESPITPPFSRPKVRSLFLYFLLFILLLGVSLAVLDANARINPTDPTWAMVIYILLFTLLSGWLWQQLKRYGVQMRYVWGQRPEHPRWLATGGLVIAALVFSLSSFLVVAGLLSYNAPDFVQTLLQEIEAEANPRAVNPALFKLLSAIATIIVAPITEEFIFRGYILQRWAVKWNLPLALILSSVLFGLLHLNPIGLTMFGLLMGVLYIKTRSLLVPIAGHTLNNLIANGMAYLPQDPNPTNLAALRTSLPVGIILLVLAAPWLVWFIFKNFPRRDAAIPYVVNAQKSAADA